MITDYLLWIMIIIREKDNDHNKDNIIIREKSEKYLEKLYDQLTRPEVNQLLLGLIGVN